MKCGLVILNYVDYIMTQKLLDAVKDFPEINHITVVDNHSPNESYDVLKQYKSDKITVLQSDRNGGYSYGNNIGIRHLIKNFSPDIIGIANPDVMFGNELVRRIKETFEAYPDYALLAGVGLTPEGEYIGNSFFGEHTAKGSIKYMLHELTAGTLRKIASLFRPEHKSTCSIKNYLSSTDDKVIQVWGVLGCLFFIRTKDIQAIGLFDENVFMYFEEHILSVKLQRLGRKVGVLKDVTHVHNHGIHYVQIQKSKISFMERFRKTFSLSVNEKSRIYLFNHYLTSDKTLQTVYLILMWIIKCRHLAGDMFRWLFHFFMRQNKRGRNKAKMKS